MKPQAQCAVELLSCSQNSPCVGLAQLPVSAAEMDERIDLGGCFHLQLFPACANRLFACVGVWEIGCDLVLLDIRVHCLGQDSFQVVIVSRQCCAVMCFWSESIPFHQIIALSSFPELYTSCYPFVSLQKSKYEEGPVCQSSCKWGDCLVRRERRRP